MTREEARKKGIEHARAALAGARAGAVTSLSDGRKLAGEDADRLWERTLHALESGSSPTDVWRTASPGLESTADGSGYVWGTTSITREWSYAIVHTLTLGDGAEGTVIEGDFEVYLRNRDSPTTRSEFRWYVVFSQGDFATGEVQINWDYNWVGEFAIATTRHAAKYPGYDAWTTSSAAN